MTYCTAYPAYELLSYELLANPTAAAADILLNVRKIPIYRLKLYKEGRGRHSLLLPLVLLQHNQSSFLPPYDLHQTHPPLHLLSATLFGASILYYFWNFNRNQTENDRYWQKNYVLIFAKCLKCTVFLHLHLKFAKSAIKTPKNLSWKISLWV